MEIIFLGTGSMFPTEKRAHPGVFVRDEKINFLLDCGENIQRQMRIAKISPTKIDCIFITHWHGDHTLGLAGVIQSLSANQRKETLEIYGPKDTKKKINNLLKVFSFDLKYKIKVNEINLKKGKIKKIKENEDFYFEAIGVEHGIPCINYNFIRKGNVKINLEYTKKFGLSKHPLLGKLQKGKTITYKNKKITPEKATYKKPDKKLTYITDTKYFKELKNFAKNSDILIAESTFSGELKEKASKYKHMTFLEGAKIAKESKSKKLVLTHFSQRYSDLKNLKKEVKKIFSNTYIAEDFKKFKI